MYKLELIDSFSELNNNIAQFNKEIKENEIPLEKVKQFYTWFYVINDKLFAPSKYIKFKTMNYDKYKYFDDRQIDFPDFHGKISDVQKYKWFSQVSKDSDLHDHLLNQLERVLNDHGYNHELRKNTKFLISNKN